MPLRPRQILKQVQKLVMTQQMRQSVTLLQLPLLELQPLIEQELTNNPCLEEVAQVLPGEEPVSQKDEFSPPGEPALQSITNIMESANEESRRGEGEDNWVETINPAPMPNDDFFTYKSTLITREPSLQEELLKQFKFSHTEPEMLSLGEIIIGNIDDNGYLKVSLEEIASSQQKSALSVENALKAVQQLDPPGVGARDLKECLLLQLERQATPDPLARQIIQEHLDDLGRKRFKLIAKKLNVPLDTLKEKAAVIAALDPKPGRIISRESAALITPDIILEKTSEGYNIVINHQTLPHLRVNVQYKQILADKNTEQKTKDYLRQKMYAASGLIRALYQRQQTLTRIMQCVIEAQYDFLEKGREHLKPLSMRQVAERLGLHESTISRAIARKYVQVPFGVVQLKDFFSSEVHIQNGESESVGRVKLEIENLIREEPADKPLSDQQIINCLKQKGVILARRTVAKYRQQLKILPAYLRKK